MTDASNIVDQILPYKKNIEDLYDIGWKNARQRLLTTYGKEWVGVPSVGNIYNILLSQAEETGEPIPSIFRILIKKEAELNKTKEG